MLAGANIIVTRPTHQAQSLCQLIQEAQGNPISLPTLEIEFIKHNEALRDIIRHFQITDYALFLSANAVLAIAPLIKQYWPQIPTPLKFIAIGEGTQKALLMHNLPVDLMPIKESSSEGLLALPELQSLNDKRIIIFKGAGGRGILTPALQQRDAQVMEAIVYQRVCPMLDTTAQVSKWKSIGIDAVIVTSSESLTNLFAMISDKEWLTNLTFIVISERVAEQARRQGIKHCIIATDANDQRIMEALLNNIPKKVLS